MILLRPYTFKDAPSVLSWCNSEDTFNKWTAGKLGKYPISKEEFNFVTRFSPFIAYNSTGNVGFFTMRNINANEIRFCFIIVSPDTRGKGVAKEMLKKGLEIAFESSNVKKFLFLFLKITSRR